MNAMESRINGKRRPGIDASDGTRHELEILVLSSIILGGFQPHVETNSLWFADKKHRELFLALCEMDSVGQPVTDIALVKQVAKRCGIDTVELSKILTCNNTAAHLSTYSENLHAEWVSSQIHSLTLRIQQRIESGKDCQDLLQSLSKYQTSTKRELQVRSATNEIANNKGMRPAVVDGIIRQGETVNVIAPPKLGKSWLVLGLALAIANGKRWLWWPAVQGRVLIIDNELHSETSTERLAKVSEASGLSTDNIDIYNARGEGLNILQLRDDIHIGTGYSLIILDAFYRFIPPGISENDNAGMMSLYNAVDTIAANTGAAIALIHHTTKGNQGTKEVTDVGAGAGSISRAADSHLILRPHEVAGSAVMEAVTRSFVSPEPKSIVFDYPEWRPAEFEPEVRGSKQKSRKEETDQETKDCILPIVQKADGKPVTRTKLRTLTGFGDSRVSRGFMLLEQAGEVTRCKVKSRKTGKKVDAIRLKAG